MLLSTSPIVEGRTIQDYLGIVSAATITMLPGGDKAVQKGWKAGVEKVCDLLEQQASELGANGVIAISMQLSGSNLCATGTAVRFEP